jgi:hypothetical protein
MNESKTLNKEKRGFILKKNGGQGRQSMPKKLWEVTDGEERLLELYMRSIWRQGRGDQSEIGEREKWSND